MRKRNIQQIICIDPKKFTDCKCQYNDVIISNGYYYKFSHIDKMDCCCYALLPFRRIGGARGKGCPQICITGTVDRAPDTLPCTGTVQTLSQTGSILTATGGTAPYTFTVFSGSLPPGWTLTTNGILSGAISGGGTFNFTVQVTDSKGCTALQAFVIIIIG